MVEMKGITRGKINDMYQVKKSLEIKKETFYEKHL